MTDSAAQVSIRPAEDRDDEAIVAIQNADFPDHPPRTVEDMRYRRDTIPPGAITRYIVADLGGQVVGFAMLRQMWGVRDPGLYFVRVHVLRDRRGQGIGSRLLDAALEVARGRGARRLYSEVAANQPEAEQFSVRRGFKRTGREERESRLDTAAARFEGYEGLEERLAAEGIRIATLAEVGTDEHTIHAVHVMSDRAARDVPSTEEFAETPCDLWHDEVLRGPGMSPEYDWVAWDGSRPVGLAFLKLQGPGAAWNDFTATDPAYRGRGIARALKRRTVEWARQNGVRWIYTGNDESNARMLAINVRMGYERLPPTFELAREMDQEG